MNIQATKKVWDPLVRVFHWTLVLSFVIAFATHEDVGTLHVYAGYLVLGLVAFRIVWGLVGTHYARFSEFVYGPGKVMEYLRSLLGPRPKHYYGHNPAGGWMVLVLLAVLLLSTLSGLQLYGLEGKGPLAEAPSISLIQPALASDDDDDDRRRGRDREDDAEDFWEDIHESTSDFAVILVLLHIAGVVVSSRLHKENLVRAMFTGRKPVPPQE